MIDKEQVLKLYNDNSAYQIAKIFGVSHPTILKILKNEGYDIKRKVYSIDETFFENIDSEEKAWILGWWYSDGTVAKSKHLISLTVSQDDIKLLENIKTILKYSGPICKNIKHKLGRDVAQLSIGRKKLAEDLIKLGCIPNKSLVLEFPKEEQVQKQLIPHFLRGVFEGDGSLRLGNDGNYVRVSIVSSKNFCDGLCNNVLIPQNIEYCRYIKNNNKSTSDIHISKTKHAVKFLDYIYSNAKFTLDRKYKQYLNINREV